MFVSIFWLKYYGHHKEQVDSVFPVIRKEKDIFAKSYIEIPKLNKFVSTCFKHLITLSNETEVLYINY